MTSLSKRNRKDRTYKIKKAPNLRKSMDEIIRKQKRERMELNEWRQ